MAERFRIDNWYVDVWDGKDWARLGPYCDDKADEVFRAHKRSKPDWPARLIGEVIVEGHRLNEADQ